MLLDANTIFSAAQAVTATVASTSYIDQQNQAESASRAPWIEFLITTTFTPNSATIRFEIECDNNTSFSSPQTLFMTGALADTLLVAGYRAARIRMPFGNSTQGVERYIQARYTDTGTAVAGKIDCRLVDTVSNLII